MYCPVGWPRVLVGRGGENGGDPVQLLRHRTKNLVVEVRERCVRVWHSRLHLMLASYTLSEKDVAKTGVNVRAVMKPDGGRMVLATSAGFLYFLEVIYESSAHVSAFGKSHYSYRQHGMSPHIPGLELPAEGHALDQISLSLVYEIMMSGEILAICNCARQLMVSTEMGIIYRVDWDGRFETQLSIYLNKLTFANDLLPTSRGQPPEGLQCAVDICHCPELHGFVLVLRSGKAAFVTCKSAMFDPELLQAVWLRETPDAVCVAVNPRYALVACGRKNGLVDIYSLDEPSGAWNRLHTNQLSRLQFADSDQHQLGQVQCVQWSPVDHSVLAVVWKNGGLSLWTVFGSLVFHSLGNQPSTPTPLLNPHCSILQSLCWSVDSYHLWLLPRGRGQLGPSLLAQPCEKEKSLGAHLVVLTFLKSAFVSNPVISNHHHLLLHTDDRLYLGPPSSTHVQNGAPVQTGRRKDFNGCYGNENQMILGLGGADTIPQWKIIQVPVSYLTLNWPVQFVAISEDGDGLAVAGKAGFALYSLPRRKWRLFGSELQEQSLICRGGLSWYRNDVVVFSCRVLGGKDEIQFYSIHLNLDTSRQLHCLTLSSPVSRINALDDSLVVATRDCKIILYQMHLTKSQGGGGNDSVLSVSQLHVMSFLGSLARPWATSLVSVVPSAVRTEPGSGMEGLQSLMVNVGGRVMMVQRELPRPQTTPEENQNPWSFSSPVVIAASVEAMWTPPSSLVTATAAHNHLMESIWLACGYQGMKVWLPLYPRDEGHPTFLSKRIMLTIPSASSFPQNILFSEGLIVGVSHEPMHGDHALSTPIYLPPSTIRRTMQLFLNHVLRQLLKRNLGSHALHIARRHAHLPYFAHILELMLHEILEEEAPGSIPIPDALLPRIVDFIKQFPHFLETVGFCARKTEVALWNYLFAAVGNPKDLFELCLSDGRLKTAASYLIIIQNLEAASVSRHLASQLLDAALDNNYWELCNDLVRFLKAIGPVDSNPTSPTSSVTPATPQLRTPVSSGLTAASTPSAVPPTPTMSSRGPDLDLSVVSVTRDHLTSGSLPEVVSISGGFQDPSSGKIIKRPNFTLEMDSKEEFFIELILSRHARKLLANKCLKDLGLFAAHLEFNLSQWMSRERHRAARVDDFVETLKDLHKQFHWPLPQFRWSATPSVAVENATVVTKYPQSVQTTPPQDQDEMNDSLSSSRGGLKRSNRPPDLHLDQSPVVGVKREVGVVTVAEDHDMMFASSTPSKMSTTGSYSALSHSTLRVNSSDALGDEVESFTEAPDEPSVWEGDGTDISTSSWTAPTTRSLQAEREIRYFVAVTEQAMCLEWVIVLSVLLMDTTVLVHTSQQLQSLDTHTTFPEDTGTRLTDGIKALSVWATNSCPGYLQFLLSLSPLLQEWQLLLNAHIAKQTVVPLTTPLPDHSTAVVNRGLSKSVEEEVARSPVKQTQEPPPASEDAGGSACVVS